MIIQSEDSIFILRFEMIEYITIKVKNSRKKTSEHLKDVGIFAMLKDREVEDRFFLLSQFDNLEDAKKDLDHFYDAYFKNERGYKFGVIRG